MKTLAAVLERIDTPLELIELEIPSLNPGQVLVDIHYSSLCHTQINEMRGRKGQDRFLPHTLGHEGSGIVLETGPGVESVKPGDKVVLTWLQCRGMNAPSTQYSDGSRKVNSGPISTFLKTAVISENRMLPLSHVSMDLMPLLGCAIPTGYGTVLNLLKPEPGSSIAIWGAGGVGLSAIMGAKAMGCEKIIAVDVHEIKLQMAMDLGATHGVDGRTSPTEAILEITGGKGVDYGLDCAGLVSTIEAGFASVRKGGGRFVVAGNPPAGKKIQVDPFDLISGKTISGSWGGECKMEKDLHRFEAEYRSGTLHLEKLVTHRFELGRINEAVSLMETGKCGRILFEHR